MDYKKINCYQLTDPGTYMNLKSKIRQELFPKRNPNSINSKIHFDISDASGCISFADYNEIWQNTKSEILIHQSKDAKKYALDFFNKSKMVMQNIENDGNKMPSIPDIFPTENNLNYVDAQIQFTPKSNIPDHWLVRFNIGLKPESFSSFGIKVPQIPVFGSKIDLRLKPNGHVIGLWSTWRPFVNKISSNLIFIADDHHQNIISSKQHDENENDVHFETHHVNHKNYEAHNNYKHLDSEKNEDHKGFDGDVQNIPSVSIFYRLSPPNFPQKYIAPFYYTYGMGGHHGMGYDIIPASEHSLKISVNQISNKDGTETALIPDVVNGNKSNERLEFFWTYRQEDLGIMKHIKDSRRILKIPTGIYDVNLTVRDSITGSIDSCSLMVCTTKNNEQESKRLGVG